MKQEQRKNSKILLHACCGICSGYPIKHLIENNYLPVVYFYNPNIQPVNDFIKRLESQRIVCEHCEVELIVEKYNTLDFEKVVKGYENEPEKGKRCDKCFELRLKKTADKAKELGIRQFTTSIVISPHKDFFKISEIGKKIAKDKNLEYVDIDFKKKDGFLKSNEISKELSLYRQNYCGCRFSNK